MRLRPARKRRLTLAPNKSLHYQPLCQSCFALPALSCARLRTVSFVALNANPTLLDRRSTYPAPRRARPGNTRRRARWAIQFAVQYV